MTKSALISLLWNSHRQLTPSDTQLAVDTLLAAITLALASDNRIEIRGFGSFRVNHRAERLGRNPKTGERVLVPPKFAPHFKPGKGLRERVDSVK
jgi:integration host factor subunit beta